MTSTPILRPRRHSAIGFTLPLPEPWETAEDLHGVALLALEPARPPFFRASANVTVEEAPAGAKLDDWVQRSHEQLARVVDRLDLIDRELTEVDGLTAIRSLSHHVDAEHGGVALEQGRCSPDPMPTSSRRQLAPSSTTGWPTSSIGWQWGSPPRGSLGYECLRDLRPRAGATAAGPPDPESTACVQAWRG